MAITSEFLGKLGGADVETIPVSSPHGGGTTLCSLDLDPNKTYLVGVSGVSSRNVDSTYPPQVTIGDTLLGYGKKNNIRWGIAGVVSGPVGVVFNAYRDSATYHTDYNGEVFIVEVDL